jgi:hypothetical protein
MIFLISASWSGGKSGGFCNDLRTFRQISPLHQPEPRFDGPCDSSPSFDRPTIRQPAAPEPSIIDKKTIADLTRVVEQTGILPRTESSTATTGCS